MEPAAPELSVVIPVHNEQAILADSVLGLLDRVPVFCADFEILLCENGSTDRTLAAAGELAARHPRVRVLQSPEPNYGRALKAGILAARGRWVVCDEIDLCDTSFYRVALEILRAGRAEMVVGSKLAPGARDERPWLRHLATQVLNTLLRIGLGFRGTDTHGLKAFARAPLVPVVEACVVDRNLFASEFVIRAERSGLRLCELPLDVREKRTPTINLARRVPGALADVATLAWVIRVREKLPAVRPGKGCRPGSGRPE